MELDNISIAYWGKYSLPESLCHSIPLPEDISQLPTAINNILAGTPSQWLFFWDFKNGAPDTSVIQILSGRNVDVFHAGLKMGMKGLPKLMNYVDPIWMYNIDCSENIEHTSFRMNISACMIKTDALKKISIPACYNNVAMFSIAIGYRLIKSGAIMRYAPDLLNLTLNAQQIPDIEEWKFAREFYTSKWQIWIALNKKGLFQNFSNWLAVKKIARVKISPCIHSSLEKDITTPHKNVSVLAPTLNRYPYLRNELMQLNAQTILPHEILITDQTDKEQRENIDTIQYPLLNIKYFPQEDKGQCIAWNKLLEESTGEYILFLGDDADYITPDFVQRMLHTVKKFDADMVASNVIEIGIPAKKINHHYYLSDTFPITLIKKSMLQKSGYMDMFFNKNVRADKDLATRCHLHGCLMIFNPTATIHHHRASVGGLRTHKARVITNYIAKNSITKFALPTSSEIYFTKKYFTDAQYRVYMKIKYLNQIFVSGSISKSLLKLLVFFLRYAGIKKQYRQNMALAEEALSKLKDPKATNWK